MPPGAEASSYRYEQPSQGQKASPDAQAALPAPAKRPLAVPSAFYCPSCTKHFDVLLPVEPLYSLVEVAALLLTNVAALVNLMGSHRAELSAPLYRTIKHRRHRFLPASDVRLLRGFLYSTRRYKGLRKLLNTPVRTGP